MNAFPDRILLATDLNPRSDRAMERAVRLARDHGSKLVALYVLEQGQGEDGLSWRHVTEDTIGERILREMGAEDVDVTTAFDEGRAGDAVLRAADQHGCGLVVMGMGRFDVFGRSILGSTTERVISRSRVPVLVVKERVYRGYRNMVVATDFSDSSMHALQTAARFFPNVEPVLFHAYRVPYEGFTSRKGSGEWFEQEARRERDEFMSKVKLDADFRERMEVILEYGSIHELLDIYVRDTGADLAVVGSHGRSGIFNIPLGNEAKQLVATTSCDMLVVPEPRAMGVRKG